MKTKYNSVNSRFLCPRFHRRLADGKVHGKLCVQILLQPDASLARPVDPAAQLFTWTYA